MTDNITCCPDIHAHFAVCASVAGAAATFLRLVAITSVKALVVGGFDSSRSGRGQVFSIIHIIQAMAVVIEHADELVFIPALINAPESLTGFL